ncbi:MAG: hypothetical protein HWE30_13610 [Methylocystaceae bacterium]|nr:hypothetical protein [Methylocystaceae bacterium]
MASFLKTLTDRLFGYQEDEETLPDDGGLGEFAKQFAKQLEREKQFGKGPTVSADNVLSVQQGRHGSKSYLLDTSDFKKAIMAELRDSVAPVCEGILKTRCGEKGTGFMCVRSLYIFHVYNKDPVAEYNAAMDIIDDIGERLLGDRYITGERRINVPVAQIEPDEMFNEDGSFNFSKAKKTIKFVREANIHGPVNVDWEKGEVVQAQGSDEWVEQNIDQDDVDLGDWKEQVHQRKEQTQGQWQKLEHNNPIKEKIMQHEQPAKPVLEQQDWKSDDGVDHKNDGVTEVAWGDFITDKAVGKTAETREKPKPKAKAQEPDAVKPNPVGTLSLVFRPCWDRASRAINSYAGCPYRKDLHGTISFGDKIYEGCPDPMIEEMDGILASQAARHIQATKDIEQKVIILPFHLHSLLAPKRTSPLKPLRQLQGDFRQSVQIEIIGIRSNTSLQHIKSAIKAHQHKFKVFGLRCELGDLSRSLVNNAGLQFLSCDVQASATTGLQVRKVKQDLADLHQFAGEHGASFYAFGLRDQNDLQNALREGASLINGRALAKEVRRPGKVIPVSPEKLITL